MSKYYNHKFYILHKEDIEIYMGEGKIYLPWVAGIANTFPRQHAAIGILNLNDLISAGNEGMWRAYQLADHSRLQAEVWSYIKKRIKFAIKQEINVHANMVKIPERMIREATQNLKALDKILVNVFPQFFDEEIWIEPDFDTSWQSIQLEQLINDGLNKHVPNLQDQEILLRFYGIGFDRMTTKELAAKYNKNPGAIQKIIARTRNKLNNEEFKNIIEIYYKNES